MNDFSLSVEQEYAFEKFTQGENLFITGPGGTGKTKLIEHLVSYCDKTGRRAQVCAMTGCATALLPPSCHARTFNSFTGIKLARGEIQKIVDTVLKKKANRQTYRKLDVLIVDEVSMMSKKVFELVNEIAKTARLSNLPYGGLQVIFTGDFLQLPPVPSEDEKDSGKFCFESSLWESVFPFKNNIELRTMFRQKDPIYQSILLEIRKGSISHENKDIIQRYVKPVPKEEDAFISKLYPLRYKADMLNAQQYSLLTGEEYEYVCVRQTKCQTNLESGKTLTVEQILKGEHLSQREKEYELNMLMNTSNFSEKLALKKGAVVMCTSNVELERGICNGSQGIIKGFTQEMSSVGKGLPIVEFANGLVRVMELVFRQNEEYPTLAVGQIPLILAWGMTIHKIQGATLDHAEMDIGNSIFECGQTYVALSRIKSLGGLYLSGFQPQNIRANNRALSFYKELGVVNYEKELKKLKEYKSTLKSVVSDKELEEESIEEETKTLTMAPTTLDSILVFNAPPTPNEEKPKKIQREKSHVKKETTADRSWNLYLEHHDLSKIAEIRGLKKNTVLEHIVSKLPDDRIVIEELMSLDTYKEIREVIDALGPEEPLNIIKQNLRWNISYTDIKIAKYSIPSKENTNKEINI